MMPKTEVRIGKLRLKNPVMVASGTWGEEYGEFSDARKLGAIVAKTITLLSRQGNPPPRVAETPSGMLNSIGLENKGLEDFLKTKLPRLAAFGVPVIASIAGEEPAELVELARRLKKVDALEVNLSCPNVKHGAREGLIAQDPDATHAAIAAVRKATLLPVIAKLTPNVTDIARIAAAAETAGADAVLVANTLLGMAIDIGTRRPKLGNVCGGLSGPAVKPVALRLVWETSRKVRVPVIGCGGIMDGADAVEFILAGATAVQVGTANFVDPSAPLNAIKGIEAYMKAHRVSDISALVGGVRA